MWGNPRVGGGLFKFSENGAFRAKSWVKIFEGNR